MTGKTYKYRQGYEINTFTDEDDSKAKTFSLTAKGETIKDNIKSFEEAERAAGKYLASTLTDEVIEEKTREVDKLYSEIGAKVHALMKDDDITFDIMNDIYASSFRGVCEILSRMGVSEEDRKPITNRVWKIDEISAYLSL